MQTTGDLAYLDYGSRMYDPRLGRWMGADPATQFTSPYVFGANSPYNFVDPDGEFVFSAFLGPLGVILDAACWGAVIGVASYTVSSAFSGFQNWSWGEFGKQAGLGFVLGAIGGAG